jgi:hypothetical protein
MVSPIQNKIGMVFVPVSDVLSAIGWYGRILGVSIKAPSHGGIIADVPTVGDTGLILDGTKKQVRNSSQPLLDGGYQAGARIPRPQWRRDRAGYRRHR